MIVFVAPVERSYSLNVSGVEVRSASLYAVGSPWMKSCGGEFSSEVFTKKIFSVTPVELDINEGRRNSQRRGT